MKVSLFILTLLFFVSCKNQDDEPSCEPISVCFDEPISLYFINSEGESIYKDGILNTTELRLYQNGQLVPHNFWPGDSIFYFIPSIHKKELVKSSAGFKLNNTVIIEFSDSVIDTLGEELLPLESGCKSIYFNYVEFTFNKNLVKKKQNFGCLNEDSLITIQK